MERSELERRWLILTSRDLPGLAATRGWPIRHDHCFARVLLDGACGGVWYDSIAGRPARTHAPDAILRHAVALGEDVLAGRADLGALNRQSLAWRARTPRQR